MNADRPIIVGDDDGSPVIQVISTALVAGIRKGTTRWVSGSGVEELIDNGAFIAIVGSVEEADDAREDSRSAPPTSAKGAVEHSVVEDGEDALDDVHDDDTDNDDTDSDDIDEDQPAKGASKGDWQDYAALHGVDTGGWTKQDIVDHFT